MAEFCEKCAKKYGFRPDEPPLLCEGCGEIFEEESIWTNIKRFFQEVLDQI